MPYEKFDPRGRRAPEKSFLKEHKSSPFIVFLQLAGVFIMVRLVMIITEIMFFRIPVLDGILISIVRMFKNG